jgi:hypothetical protein
MRNFHKLETVKHLHIIHLDRRTDRLQKLTAQLKEQNIYACLWPGIIDPVNSRKGIARAHQQIVAFAKQEKLSQIIIAEDDIQFTSVGAFDYFINNRPAQFDLYLASIYYGKISADNTVNDFAGLTLYSIHENFYDQFLAIDTTIDIDRALAGKGKFVVCNPFVAIQHNGYSDNKKMVCNYDTLLEGRILFSGEIWH